jgi:hypothetical protein
MVPDPEQLTNGFGREYLSSGRALSIVDRERVSRSLPISDSDGIHSTREEKQAPLV